MKIEMSESGTLTIYPETSLEAFALREWTAKAYVVQRDMLRLEDGHWLSSKLIVSGELKGLAPT